jgi:hypothetical protein
MYLNYFIEERNSYMQATLNVDNSNNGTATIIVTEKSRIKMININVKLSMTRLEGMWGSGLL